jgi:hypothetical protein
MAKCRIGGCGRWVPDYQLVCERCFERHLKEEAKGFESNSM